MAEVMKEPQQITKEPQGKAVQPPSRGRGRGSQCNG